ncbi:non sense mediated decay [Hyphodiscus hymeniophilus]|uniref:Non sense mediated decay n=1 Tax=Hyphodiscus hymeniophilus TaxID=353542 RepID=A0A9P6VKY2_9HELO|nr:non sense mediated decay [Hyphodiscus hymeniophilus]
MMETRFLQRVSLRALKHSPSIRLIRRQHTSHKPSQVNPIGDYYASLLEASTSNIASKPPTTASASSQPPVTSDAEQVEDSGPAILFSSRLSSPLERRSEIRKKSTLVAGVLVPPRPDEPDNCCMSGCVNCVWDRYGDELEEWAGARREADQALKKERARQEEWKLRASRKGIGGTGLMLGEGEKGAAHTAFSMDDDGGGSESNWETGLDANFTSEELFKGVPVGIREFMKQEKRLKEKHAREGTSGG